MYVKRTNCSGPDEASVAARAQMDAGRRELYLFACRFLIHSIYLVINSCQLKK